MCKVLEKYGKGTAKVNSARYYKVVSKCPEDHLWSPGLNQYCESRVEYLVDQWVRPKKGNGPLAVFDCLAAACGFITNITAGEHDFEELQIFTCNIVPSHKGAIWTTELTPIRLEALPIGTILAKEVKLTGKALKTVTQYEWYNEKEKE